MKLNNFVKLLDLYGNNERKYLEDKINETGLDSIEFEDVLSHQMRIFR